MRVSRLGQILEPKYLVSQAVSSPKEVLDRVKSDILNNYRHWVLGKYRALRILAEADEPYAKKLLAAYSDLISGIDTYSPVQILNRINNILGMIQEMKSDPSKTYRHSIHNSVTVSKVSDQNYREQLKLGFETNLKNISFGLEKQAKILRALLDKETALLGGAVKPQRKELSKEKLLMFMRTPAAQTYGLDNMEVMTRMLQYPELREKITTLINAIDRGHYPVDGIEIMSEARAIKKWFDQAATTNVPALEKEPEQSAAPISLFEEPK